jgi:1-acyl-sn-glycerol-3-phosphate acyltransferase
MEQYDPSDLGSYGRTLGLRDPDYIRSWMPIAELFARLYFRVRYAGLDTVPQRDPLIFVGNHSGGLSTPDTAMAAHGFWSRFGADREIYALVHPDVFKLSKMAVHLARVGGLAASARMATQVLERGASLLIYPGAGDEAYRPHNEANRVKLGGNSAYVRLAILHGAPIVPVVCLGGHDTLVVLDDGRERARALGLEELGVERLPLVYAWPFGLSLTTGYTLPFPARIDINFGPPIRLDGFGRSDARDREVVDWCHAQVELQMQRTLDGMVDRRKQGVAYAQRQ